MHYNGILQKNGGLKKYSMKCLAFCEKARKINGGFVLIQSIECSFFNNPLIKEQGMNLKITGINIDVTAAMREHIEKKLERINRHAEVISIAVTLTVEKLNHKAEASVHLAGSNLHVETVESDMYAAVDVLMDKLDRMVLKHKEKHSAHHANSSGRESAAMV